KIREEIEGIREYKKSFEVLNAANEEINARVRNMQKRGDMTRVLNEIKNRFEDMDKKLVLSEKLSHGYAKKSDLEDFLATTKHSSQAFASKKDIDELMKELEEYKKTAEKKTALENVELQKIREEFEEYKQIIEKKMSFEDVGLDKTRRKFEEDMQATANKLDLTMQEIRNKIEREAKAFYDFINSTDVKRLSDEIAQIKQGLVGSDTERNVMDLTADIDEVDKRLVEIEMNLKDVKRLESQTRKTLEHVENFDKDIKMEATKIITSQLAEFAKYVDRRLPSVVTRDEFSRSMIELNHRISTVETPDLSYISKRAAMLEQKLDEIYSLLKAFDRSLPVVVE
ncbi:MAG: hypothetical protein QMD85_05790, partial [Candidatus Aenigmarchaeota archaeon]|nr:hypothetical protein [Candidatus Aenigmarchaeota archaeon]